MVPVHYRLSGPTSHRDEVIARSEQIVADLDAGWVPSKKSESWKLKAYCPEVPFEHDGPMIYSLRQNGWRKGIPQMENDVWINIQSRTISQEQRDLIAKVIVDALNKSFPASS